MSRRSRGPSGVGIGLIGTIGVHATAVAFVIMTATRARAVTPPTYAVRLVAAPDPTPDQRKVPDVLESLAMLRQSGRGAVLLTSVQRLRVMAVVVVDWWRCAAGQEQQHGEKRKNDFHGTAISKV